MVLCLPLAQFAGSVPIRAIFVDVSTQANTKQLNLHFDWFQYRTFTWFGEHDKAYGIRVHTHFDVIWFSSSKQSRASKQASNFCAQCKGLFLDYWWNKTRKSLDWRLTNMSWKQEVDIGLNVKPLHFNDLLLQFCEPYTVYTYFRHCVLACLGDIRLWAWRVQYPSFSPQYDSL